MPSTAIHGTEDVSARRDIPTSTTLPSMGYTIGEHNGPGLFLPTSTTDHVAFTSK